MDNRAQLFIWNDRFVYTSPRRDEISSVRYTATILATSADNQVVLGFNDGAAESGRMILVAPHVSRSLRCDGPFVSINYEPQSYEYHQLIAHLRGRRTSTIEFPGADAFERLDALHNGDLDCGDIMRLTSDLASAAVSERPEPPVVDLRVLAVAHRIKAELPNPPNVETLASFAGISSDWLGHLFTEQMGVSMKSYLVWAKMRRAATLLNERDNLADVAAEVGFSDAPHLTRSFMRFFGVTPSYLADPRRVLTRCCEM